MTGLYIIPDRSCMEESLQLAGEYGAYFEYNDFFLPSVLDDEEKVRELISFYKSFSRDRQKDLLHGAFLDITVHSEDARIRQVSEMRVRQSVEIAVLLGIRGVIFHTNQIPNFKTKQYKQHWLDSNEVFFRKILSEYPDIEILLENMFDEEPDLLAGLAERMTDEPGFGVCFDYAHAMVFGKGCPIERWESTLLPYTRHMHINDNDLQADLHQALGQGRIDWKYFSDCMKKQQVSCSVLIEVKETVKQQVSLTYMKKNGIYPFI